MNNKLNFNESCFNKIKTQKTSTVIVENFNKMKFSSYFHFRSSHSFKGLDFTSFPSALETTCVSMCLRRTRQARLARCLLLTKTIINQSFYMILNGFSGFIEACLMLPKYLFMVHTRPLIRLVCEWHIDNTH